jgi:hypothetical protein
MFIITRHAIMAKETLGDRYEIIWNDYLSELTINPRLCMSRYLRLRQINVHYFEKWMSKKGYSARKAKAHAICLQPDPPKKDSLEATGSSLVPVVFHEDSHSESNSRDVLTGISLTLPDGTVITIRRGSAEAVVSFLKLYSGEGAPCSD